MFSLPCRVVVAILLGCALAVFEGLPIAAAEEESSIIPETIFEKKFVGEATVEFLVGEVTTLNIDSLYMPGVSHTQIITAKVPHAKDGQEFIVIVSRDVATRLLRLGIEDPAEHLRGKVLRVSGQVDRPSANQYKLRVTQLDQLEIIRKP